MSVFARALSVYFNEKFGSFIELVVVVLALLLISASLLIPQIIQSTSCPVIRHLIIDAAILNGTLEYLIMAVVFDFESSASIH
jgi:hypothetical protein